MNFYQAEVDRIRKEYFPNQELINHLSAARNFIDNNYHKDINLKTIAAFSFLSKFHFIRQFRRCYGRTPHQYLTDKRISKAKELLKMGMPVNETCFQVGLESTNSFSALFRRYTNLSPAKFKEKQFSIRPSAGLPCILQIIKNGYNGYKADQYNG